MAVDALKEYKIRKNVQDDNEYIFYCGYGENKPISYSAIENSYKLMVQTANINHEKNVTIHGLRHSGISYLLNLVFQFFQHILNSIFILNQSI